MEIQAETRNVPTDTRTPDETAALLSKARTEEQDGIEPAEREDESSARKIAREFVVLARGAIPVIFAYTLQNSMHAVSVLIVGRLSPEALATSAFAYMFAMSTAMLIPLGGGTAIDTLASASFTGSKNPHDLGTILQRAFLVLTLFYVPIVIMWFVSEPLFIALGQERYLAKQSSHFLMVLSPGALGYIYFESLKKYLQAQEIMSAGTYVLMITSPINAVLNYLFIYTLGFGVLGAPLATGISYWLSFLLLIAYIYYFTKSNCWGGWSKASLRNLWPFAQIAFLGVIQIGTEWWAFEIVAIVAGTLGTIPLAAQSVIMTADQVQFTLPFGIGCATSSRVGNMLGARNAVGARRTASVAAFLGVFMGTIMLAVLWGNKNHFAKMFNDDERVVQLTAKVMPFVALFQIADGLSASCGGSLRGQGRQHIGAVANILSYYCGALPLGIWLAFNGWGLQGLWIGQCIALYLVGLAQFGLVMFSDWDKQVENAFNRMDQDDVRPDQAPAESLAAANMPTLEGVE